MARYSKQRQMILDAVRQNLIHPTADEIYHIIKPDNPAISLGTVYRNLNFLSENGDILKIAIPNGADRFDGNIDKHHHVICSQCGKVFDFDYDLTDLKKEVLNQTNVICQKTDITIKGICDSCIKKQK